MNFTGLIDHIADLLDALPPIPGAVMKLATAAFVLILAIALGQGLTIYMRRSLKDKMDKGHLNIMIKIIYYSILGLAIVVFIFPILGIESSGLLVTGGVVGIIIGFASQSIVGNLISGFFLIVERPINIGDQVGVDGNTGFVEDITIFSTIIRTYDGLFVRVPNQTVFTSNITNYVVNLVRRFEYVVGIRYTDDADKAIRIIKDIIEMEPFALKSPSPSVFVDSLGDDAVNISIKIWAPVSEWYDIKVRLLWVIKCKLEENGIEIPLPQRTIWFANEAPAVTLPIKSNGGNEK